MAFLKETIAAIGMLIFFAEMLLLAGAFGPLPS